MIKRRIYYIALNSLFMGLLYLFLFEGSGGAENVVTVWVYMLAFFSIFYCTAEVQRSIAKHGRTFPVWIGVPLDVLAIVGLLWFGHIGLGCASIFHSVMELSAYGDTP